jgi:lactate racemase
MQMSKAMNLKYGKGEINCEFDQQWKLLEAKAPHLHTSDALDKALHRSNFGVNLSEFVKDKKRITVIVPDQTRKCRLDYILPKLVKQLEECHVDRFQCTILFANGTHNPQCEETQRQLVGEEIFSSMKVLNHSALSNDVVYLGTTSRGTHVSINRLVAESDGVIAVGPVMHHYFAGFGGGPKLLVPGTAHQTTILENHRLTLTKNGTFHSNCTEGTLNGNPVYEDIVEAIRWCPPTWYLGLVSDDNDNILFAESGDIIPTHSSIAAKVATNFEVGIQKQADLVIVSAGGYPRDLTFIQAHKTIRHACAAVKDGGVVLCLAECPEGIGSSTFLDWFRYSSSHEMSQKLIESYTLNGHTVLSLQTRVEKAAIILISSLPHEIVKKMRLIPASTFEEGLTIARSRLHDTFMTFVLPFGATTVPRLHFGSNEKSLS